MGGAFVAVADDATANYWNPAGLIRVQSSGVLEQQWSDTRLGSPNLEEGTSDLTTFVSLASPTVGLSYYRLRSWQVDRMSGNGVGDSPASLSSLVTQHVGITLVQPLSAGVALATVLKAVRGTVAQGFGDGGAPVDTLFDQTSALSGRSTTRLDLDLGVMVGVGSVRLGFVGRNLREPEFAVSDDAMVRLRRQFRAGLSIRPTQALVVAADVDLSIVDTAEGRRRNVAVGVEHRFGPMVVRAGGRVNVEEDDFEPVVSFGFSAEVWSQFWLDGQVTRSRNDGDRGWGVSMRSGL
jgi:hypothetical protein